MERIETRVRFVQKLLGLKKDGILGIKTIEALKYYFKDSHTVSYFSKEQKLTAFIQEFLKRKGFDTGQIDGFFGPQTDFAFSQLISRPFIRDEEDDSALSKGKVWPTYKEIPTFYGDVGKNIKLLKLPYDHRLSWNPKEIVTRTYCHEKVHKSYHCVLSKVLNHYGIKAISELKLDMFGGCFNIRKMRGGSKHSTHSWGVAVDYHPEGNRLPWGRDKAAFAQPEYDAWWSFWEAEGWVSLGRKKNYDWMHIQAVEI